jgi:uncharacterized protein YecE (DUF72 family)
VKGNKGRGPQQLSLFGDAFSAESTAASERVLPVEPTAQQQHLAARLPSSIHLGTSSWSFPGWTGLVYAPRPPQATAARGRGGRGRAAPAPSEDGGRDPEATWETERRLAQQGLSAYAAHPLFRTVSLDRTFYSPLTVDAFADYAREVPDGFRFVVKAPQAFTDAVLRRSRSGEPARANPSFLDAAAATDVFVRPAVAGLGTKAGPLVFQFPPLGAKLLGDLPRLIARIAAFLAALPRGPLYTVEVRDADLVCAAFGQALRDVGAVPCLAVHARMPPVDEQAKAMGLTSDDCQLPLVARWNLHAGFAYQEAKDLYAPFNRLVDEDLATRQALTRLAVAAAAQLRPVYITINNKAEGSAPLSVEALAHNITSEG